ncbi:MAG TPA: hypothetical protein DCS82_07990 [Rhodospirillaceae bacterium]|nr:hypothetical protein [Rhodospirillaceae bacterium]MBL24607.1 hypothetical protein [Rhodospirillaceae bacterium]HAA93154.1 hypothetical protein [Rhodospirillaceae bacterium]HAT35641.1 hypothetical protein [Rhodospirillaceae bacterium]
MIKNPNLAQISKRLREAFRSRPLTAWGIAVFSFCLILSFAVDPWLTPWIKSQVSENQSVYWRTITDFGRAGTYIVGSLICFIIFALLALRDPDRTSRFRVGARNSLYVFLTLVSSGIAINLMKFVIGRQRPKAMFENDFYGLIPFNTHHAMNSFPSGHSQTIWALAMALIFLFPRFAPLCIVVAILIALSRVVLTVHFLSDAIAGAFVAIVAAVLLKRYYLDKAPADSLTGISAADAKIERFGISFTRWFAEIRSHRPIVEAPAEGDTPASGNTKNIPIRRKSTHEESSQ